MENDCVFCDKPKIIEDILEESGNFFSKVGFGLAAPGQVMLISGRHYSCFADMPQDLDEEFEQAKKNLVARVTDKFSEPFLIEYGIWGQSIHHAHTHLIPLKGEDYSVESIMEEMIIPGGMPYTQIKGLEDLREIFESEGSYVCIEEKGNSYVIHTKNEPPINRDNPSPHLSYRAFFQSKGHQATLKWTDMSDRDKSLDNKRRHKTKELLTV